MSPSSTQQWTRRIRYSDQHIRVSDADRNAVAELLGQHYADGRLDQAEFDDRVGRTMAAKTRGDLTGLFDDLPETGPAGAGPAGPAGRARSSTAGRAGAAGSRARSCCCSWSSSALTSPGTPSPACSSFSRWSGPSSSSR